jgi:hypothetical protein
MHSEKPIPPEDLKIKLHTHKKLSAEIVSVLSHARSLYHTIDFEAYLAASGLTKRAALAWIFKKQQERIDQAKKEREQRAADYKQRQEPTTHYKLDGSMLADAASNFIAKSQERETWKEKIRISSGGKDDAFNDAIMDYLETLLDDNRRIEACNNIIKICRNISVELQKAA